MADTELMNWMSIECLQCVVWCGIEENMEDQYELVL